MTSGTYIRPDAGDGEDAGSRFFPRRAMNNPLFDISQYQSETPQTYIPAWIDPTAPDPAWDEIDSAPNSQKATDDIATSWRSAAEFTITLNSGLKINVLFTPGKKSELSTHQFDFTGPISPTGFKSHFVLAVEAEKFSHPLTFCPGLCSRPTCSVTRETASSP